MSLSQRKKSACNLHKEIKNQGLASSVLECSRAGYSELGVQLSAFNLPYFNNKSIKVENVYQGSKVFKNINTGDIIWLNKLYHVDSMVAKKNSILTDKNYMLVEFRLMTESNKFDVNPRYIFYNYIYIKSLVNFIDDVILNSLKGYDGFTDTMLRWYNGKVTSCQAHAIAMFIGMEKAGVLSNYMLGDINDYLALYK